jgi:C4-dicarboxylate transporter
MLKGEKIKKIREEGKALKKEINKKVLSYITAGFGFVAGLAWNEAVKSFIEYVLPQSRGTMVAKFVYALILTLILVIISFYLAKILEKDTKKEEEK